MSTKDCVQPAGSSCTLLETAILSTWIRKCWYPRLLWQLNKLCVMLLRLLNLSQHLSRLQPPPPAWKAQGAAFSFASASLANDVSAVAALSNKFHCELLAFSHERINEYFMFHKKQLSSHFCGTLPQESTNLHLFRRKQLAPAAPGKVHVGRRCALRANRGLLP